MSDTSPEMAARYRAMLMALTPGQRLEMVGDMWDMATELSMSTIDATTEADRREALFLRRYGRDFDEEQRRKIIAHLRRTAG